MGGDTEKEEGIDISEIREKGEWKKRGVNIEDNTRLMKFREEDEVKGGDSREQTVQDILRGWDAISAHESDPSG